MGATPVSIADLRPCSSRGTTTSRLVPASGHNPFQPATLRLEGIATEDGLVSELLGELRAAMSEHNVFRGKVFSLEVDGSHSVSVHFHSLPPVARGRVFEDVDLVAKERTMPGSSGGALFDLLNQMEGIAEDEDLLFLLTSNRPDLIEPALAARPGRIDLALEVPLPDEAGRRRLLQLYGEGIELDEEALSTLATRSAGVSGAFIKELVRQAWLRSALEGRDSPTGVDLVKVLDELLDERSALTRRLLGQQSDEGSPDSGALPGMVHAMKAAGMPVPRQ